MTDSEKKVTESESVAQRAVAVREKYGLTQTELADALSVDSSYVSLIEKGDRNPSRRIIERLEDIERYGPVRRPSALTQSSMVNEDPPSDRMISLLSDESPLLSSHKKLIAEIISKARELDQCDGSRRHIQIAILLELLSQLKQKTPL